MKGKLFVVSGPSGVGKNTLLNAVIDRSENVRYSVSATSRPIRPGEVDGKSYYFVSRERFEALIADDALLERRKLLRYAARTDSRSHRQRH